MRLIESARRTTRLGRELAAAFALLGFGVPALGASVLPVGNCLDDDSAQSLRTVVASAADNDTVDLSTLVCSTITLAANKGPIPISKSITLNGVSIAGTRIEGNGSRVFTISAGKTTFVTFQNMTIADGSVYDASGPAVGGCISSNGYVYVTNTALFNCSAVAKGGKAAGGALYTSAGVTLTSAYVRQNHASSDSDVVRGGGIYAARTLNASTSTISGNDASGTAPTIQGGGAFVGGGMSVVYSTIDHNHSAGGGGGISLYHTDPDTYASAALDEVTFSANTAAYAGALDHICYMCSALSEVDINNSTFAFNSADALCGGITSNVGIVAHSSIFAKNDSPETRDVDLLPSASATFSGANNLVMGANVVPQPGVVTVTADPKLTPLDFHGASFGHARTHGLALSSPALDAGDNDAGFPTDERGDGFPRVFGAHADIGAFERQANDEALFYAGFQ